ncbi:MAG: glycine cleavage T C-terminal barrel domain-containing protein, partial [Vicinamibacterales bacterium]
HGSRKALIPSQKYSPYELGLGRLVALDKGPFVGRAALAAEAARGPARKVVGLEVDWVAVEALHEAAGLPPVAPAATSRVAVPVYARGRQVGRATSTTWSPALKRLIALATVSAPHFEPGTALEIEVTVEAVRHRAAARVVPTPFFNPARKTALPPP